MLTASNLHRSSWRPPIPTALPITSIVSVNLISTIVCYHRIIREPFLHPQHNSDHHRLDGTCYEQFIEQTIQKAIAPRNFSIALILMSSNWSNWVLGVNEESNSLDATSIETYKGRSFINSHYSFKNIASLENSSMDSMPPSIQGPSSDNHTHAIFSISKWGVLMTSNQQDCYRCDAIFCTVHGHRQVGWARSLESES
jgi:hypothetical protein